MGNIVLLDDLTINKIAAGEVIERPASVIKEMVENSIDAGATNITVEIKNGGISYIRITDNGKGIPEDDLEIAFERHATSKIRSAEDLSTVMSMGFRGEALASIAAIANVEMISKTANQETGYKIVVQGGNILEKGEIGSPVGTTVTVTNLFYNTPVRYKFLKKDFTEAGYIEDVITRIALVHPEISIKLINSGKTVIQTNGNNDLKTVIYSIYGKDIANGTIEVNYSYEDMHIYGVIGKPEIARSNRANQIFFINKRYVKDKALSSAAEKAYKGMIPIGKFSFLVLNVDMNPNKVDVNVHPAKLEVRFEEENTVFKAVYHAIKESLLKVELVADTDQTMTEKRSESGLFAKIEKQDEMETNNQKNTDNSTPETIIEQIYMQKKLGQIAPIVAAEKHLTEEKNTDKSLVNLKEEDKIISPEVQKGEDIIKKIQEIKEKLVLETSNLKLNMQNKPKDLTEDYKNIENIIFQNESKNLIEEKNENEIYEQQEQKEDINKIELNENENVYEIENKSEQDNNTENISNNEETSKNFEEMYLKLFGTKPIKEEITEEKPKEKLEEIVKTENISVFDNIKEYQKPNYKFIGIVFNTYIIVEIDKEMYIIDQHAAHERILYEKVKKNYYADEEKDSQLLLLPDIITLTHKEMNVARENMDMFKKAGFMLEEFGENTIKLTGVPEMCIDLETKEMFLETLDEINSVARTAKQEIEERFIATVACKAAVKANMALTKEEVDSLMEKLLELPNPFTCPHGRPTAIKMSKYDIERKFARK